MQLSIFFLFCYFFFLREELPNHGETASAIFLKRMPFFLSYFLIVSHLISVHEQSSRAQLWSFGYLAPKDKFPGAVREYRWDIVRVGNGGFATLSCSWREFPLDLIVSFPPHLNLDCIPLSQAIGLLGEKRKWKTLLSSWSDSNLLIATRSQAL